MRQSINDKNLKCEIETISSVLGALSLTLTINDKNLKCEIETHIRKHSGDELRPINDKNLKCEIETSLYRWGTGAE